MDRRRLACDDNFTFGQGYSLLSVELQAGQSVTLIVDGGDPGDEGAFMVSIAGE